MVAPPAYTVAVQQRNSCNILLTYLYICCILLLTETLLPSFAHLLHTGFGAPAPPTLPNHVTPTTTM
jgi:hypothetical protein